MHEIISLTNSFHPLEVNCSPLSLKNLAGIPCRKNMAFNAEMTAVTVVDVSMVVQQ